MIRATHAGYVLDASVAAKWFTRHHESDRETAVALRGMHQAGRCRLIVPEFALLEILNAIRFSGRAEQGDAETAIRFLELLRLETVTLDWDLLRKATELAWEYELALYDAAYVALAERLGVPVLTADESMARKLRGHNLVARLADLALS
ncbi:MAG: type II toxin-antitoxin system VapC family toxin [Acidobacteria bacterium]|nr:type II toxin-antitoxin system VapC family toxin [Acidobacteriota bacterium]